MPGLVKIGISSGGVIERVKQLFTTGVPVPFECFYAAEVTNSAKIEKAIHDAFDDHRIHKSREFFRISPDKPRAIIELLALKNVTPGQELLVEPDDQAALNEERRRRSNFRFSLVGIKVGDILHSVFDETITCVVLNDRWVTFRGEEESLSSSALTIAHEKGLGWQAVAGPAYWKFNGKTLAELRDQFSEDE